MTSLPRSNATKRASQRAINYDTPTTTGGNNIGRRICLIVGLTCLAGFLMDLIVLGTPPNPFALEWRINFLQQAGERSIILLFGFALLLYGLFDNRAIKRILGFASLAIGVAFVLSCVLVIRDSLILRNQAIQNISNQELQAQEQIEEARSRDDLPENITLEQLQEASQQIANQADSIKQNTRQGISRVGVGSISNLVAVGLGMIGLGRLGLNRR